MASNLAELLPSRFEDLTLDHVAEIIERIGDARETPFFERKRQVTPQSLAKACAAFANTMGGLLLVGVDDKDDTLVGTNTAAEEAQLWVKDTLRGHVIPLPPVRARWLPTSEGRGILLVLVEESTATPHLLARNGAIYVRNPGSSDPLPLTDQRRLLDLVARGETSAASAELLAEELRSSIQLEPTEAPRLETLVLAATGVTAAFEESLFAAPTPAAIGLTFWGERTDGQQGCWAVLESSLRRRPSANRARSP